MKINEKIMTRIMKRMMTNNEKIWKNNENKVPLYLNYFSLFKKE
jgi:hypothetical protein